MFCTQGATANVVQRQQPNLAAAAAAQCLLWRPSEARLLINLHGLSLRCSPSTTLHCGRSLCCSPCLCKCLTHISCRSACAGRGTASRSLEAGCSRQWSLVKAR